MENIFATSLSSALAAGREKSSFCLHVFTQGNWMLFRSKPMLPLYRNHVFNLHDKSINWGTSVYSAQNDHMLKIVIGSKNRPTFRARLILTVINLAANALTNIFMSEMFNQINY